MISKLDYSRNYEQRNGNSSLTESVKIKILKQSIIIISFMQMGVIHW